MNYFLGINIAYYLLNVWFVVTQVAPNNKSSIAPLVAFFFYVLLIVWACKLFGVNS